MPQKQDSPEYRSAEGFDPNRIKDAIDAASSLPADPVRAIRKQVEANHDALRSVATGRSAEMKWQAAAAIAKLGEGLLASEVARPEPQDVTPPEISDFHRLGTSNPDDQRVYPL